MLLPNSASGAVENHFASYHPFPLKPFPNDVETPERRPLVLHLSESSTELYSQGTGHQEEREEWPLTDSTSETHSIPPAPTNSTPNTSEGERSPLLTSYPVLERWGKQLMESLKLKRKSHKRSQKSIPPIFYSVFTAPPNLLDLPNVELTYPNHGCYNQPDFAQKLRSIQLAIRQGVYPLLIKKGSSGSYFTLEESGEIIGIFKPKNEEPYGRLNPKWTKWFHRTMFPCFFGRSCLIPNLSYISEAAACLLDRSLGLHIVPYTDITWLASPTFNYDYFERKAFLSGKKPLPDKIGSLQLFLRNYHTASEFFRMHPVPKSMLNSLSGYAASTSSEESFAEEGEWYTNFWNEELCERFSLELEKLVLLDYLMRNTDRNMENWMVSLCFEPECRHQDDPISNHHSLTEDDLPHFHIGAIDNSLAFPYKHPDEWRSYPHGWLTLPSIFLRKPFSSFTRTVFLNKLTSKDWWNTLYVKMRQLHSQDSDFEDKMFRRQFSLLKGQAYNIVETLKVPGSNVYHLCECSPFYVVDEIVEISLPDAALDEFQHPTPPIHSVGYGSIQIPALRNYATFSTPFSTSAPTPAHGFSNSETNLKGMKDGKGSKKDWKRKHSRTKSWNTVASSKPERRTVIFERLKPVSHYPFFTTC
ncbi:phosphatidylinositol 4-kinase Lsb6 [Schizosaccharomyces japonicus yFS275]|uniref:Phosphatidylinositol 4-kinase n=1 Tax=Schizosaccharomyces japonicus (strain yFS275 / FY16936) TaxID=402676 RepID=B6JYB0_SCHJY|nr:phosphatidylinositol 4-kinase Lsb6 [Schizosaccharomyces japonicus yFS275]EEB06528.2 phosphatidylinositol 4-kinase Lsb6 [Schizosaccharomyces japonicus yFS275]